MMSTASEPQSERSSNDSRPMDHTRQSTDTRDSAPATAHKATNWNTTACPVRPSILPHSEKLWSPTTCPNLATTFLTESRLAQSWGLVHQHKTSVGHDRPSTTAEETTLRTLPNGDA